MATLGEFLDGVLATGNYVRADVNCIWRWDDAIKAWLQVEDISFWTSADQVQAGAVDPVKAEGFRFRVQTDVRGDAIYQRIDGSFRRIDEDGIAVITPADLT